MQKPVPAPRQMPLLELSGSAYQRGCAHGEELASMIAEFAGTVMAVHEANMSKPAAREQLLGWCKGNMEHLRTYSPKLALELEGIAAGSGVSLDDVVFLNSFLELEDFRPAGLGSELLGRCGSAAGGSGGLGEAAQPDGGHAGGGHAGGTPSSSGGLGEAALPGNAAGNPAWGCTSFNIEPSATADGHALVGQTFDMEDYYTKYNILMKVQHADGHTELVYSLAGILGLNGMNSAGVGVCINKLVAKDARQGVPYPALIRNALTAKRVGDAFGAIVFAPRACGMNYQIASADGIAWCAEVSASDYELLEMNGAIAHTNHYVSQRMRAYETPGWLTHGGSYVRSQVANRALAAQRGRISPQTLMELTCDHTNHPRCICAHGAEGEDERTAFATIAATIYDLTDLRAYVCNGRPCEGEYQEIAID